MSNETFDFTDLSGQGETVLDFSGVRSADEPMEPGIYGPAAVVDAERRMSQAGNPYWRLKFNILEGPEAGQNLWHNITVSQQSLSFLKRDLNRLGIDTTRKLTLSPDLFLGKRCMLRVDHSEWNGEVRHQVKELLPVDQSDRVSAAKLL